MFRIFALAGLVGCVAQPRAFSLRAPFTQDTDRTPVSIACHPDPSKTDRARVACTPEPYKSSAKWDNLDNTVFAQISRGLALEVRGEAANANSLDEVADSAWFENRITKLATSAARAAGACTPDDLLPETPTAKWVIDQGKIDGASLGFRVDVPGKGKFMLKADDPDQPERNTAASVIGAALYDAAGFFTTCEQIVYIDRAQLELRPGLEVTSYSRRRKFDEAALQKVLATTAHRGTKSRMQASKWLAGYPLGPFRYRATRGDDPNDIIPHEDRREARGSRLLAAWTGHWDSREQNSMDMWIAADPARPWSSPGYVRHYILDTSDAFGQIIRSSRGRTEHQYEIDFADILYDFATLGTVEEPWDRARITPGRERFGYFSARDFDPAHWYGAYPNPAFQQMTERDAAWMTRIIARFSPMDIVAIVARGHFTDPTDATYLTDILIARQRTILRRYLTRLSPLADVRFDPSTGRVCATDLARVQQLQLPESFRYAAVQRMGSRQADLPVTTGPEGLVCVVPERGAGGRLAISLRGNLGGELVIHAFDLGARGIFVVGLERPSP